MAIKIGHASIDERGKASGGKAGDSTKKEVCTRNWYNGSWHTVLRPKSSTIAEKSAKACEAACANDKIGYDQGGRNTLNTKAKAVGYDISKITEPCECDCSSLMHVCAIAGGAKLSYGSNGVTTRTMVNAFVASGDYEKLTDSKYRTSDKYLKRGDVLVKDGHTVMVLEDGASATTSSTQTKTETAASAKVKIDSARSFDASLAGQYKVNAKSGLRLRAGANTSKTILETMPHGSVVRCYGYHTGNWLYVVSASGKKGFCSKTYLVRK